MSEKGANSDHREDDEEPDEIEPAGDELDAIENADDILALAARKIRKKELAVVDHQKVKYEPFRKEFYHPPSEIVNMKQIFFNAQEP